MTALHECILRQEPLDTRLAALTTHKRGAYRADDAAVGTPETTSVALLRHEAGREYRLSGAATTRIGRLTDNDIVLDDTDVSRQHAVIADTGTGFLITDLRSTNGVEVQGERIRGSAALGDGDHIRIGNQDFCFGLRPH